MTSNYTEFKVGSIIYLRSYNSIVAKWDEIERTLTLGKDWDFSMTTIKHVGAFISNVSRRPERGKTMLWKAINEGMILYDPDMK